ncbi:PD-(D/E)XK motif protein [Metabacillus fastidiosus]|uniref:PD-(D/E)XK motif protein n=1 Tax=Metabacillus fastidiosus TaxID=1458 RepID=UPI003D288FC6
MLTNPNDIWLEMESEIIRLKKADGVVERLRVWVDDVYIYLGLNANTRKRMLTVSVPLQFVPNLQDIPDSKGYTVEFCKSSRGAEYIDITLTVMKFEYMDFFATLAMDLMRSLEKLNNKRFAVKTLIHRLTRWQQFLERENSSELSEEKQRGLLGELYVIKKKVESGINKKQVAVAWVGPTGANRDFSYKDVEVEVKTSLYRANEKMKIASELQLDESGLNHLYVYHLTIEKTPSRGWTLPKLVNRVRDLFESEPLFQQQINDKLEEMNYYDMYELSYDTQYTIRKESVFDVMGEFPRVLPSELKKGVSGCSYNVDLSECEEYIVDVNEMLGNLN